MAFAIEKAGSTIPNEVATALHSVEDWPGVTGSHTFDENGDVVVKHIVLQVVQDARFEYLAETLPAE